jgi:hypothetical protein
MTARSYCAFSAFVFALVAAAHLLRAAAGWPVVLGDWPAPVAVSWVVGAGAAALSVWGFRQLPRMGS